MQMFESTLSRSLLVILLCAVGCGRSQIVQPLSQEHVEATFEIDGSNHVLADDGNIYRVIDSGSDDEGWEFVSKVFDPEEIQRSYVVDEGVTYRVAPDTEQRFEVLCEFDESFEDLEPGLPGLIKLTSPERLRWSALTLQSPEAPTVSEYVALRNKLLSGAAEFLDSRVEPTKELAHTGSKSLKCVATSKPSSMVTCKASISCPLVYFRDGDDFWYEAYYLAKGSLPMTLVDLESEFIQEHPGIRLRIFDDGALGVELKALSKPQYRQDPDKRVAFPKDQWVCVRVHLHLSPTDGKIEIWQDGVKVLDKAGTTLPFRSAIYNSLEIGISAHGNPNESCTLYVDDVRLSTTEFAESKSRPHQTAD